MWELFHAAAELPAGRRAGWLDEACAGDLDLWQRVLPEGHAEIAVSLLNLARLEADESRTEAAIETFEQGIAMRAAALGDDHPSLVGPLRRRAELLRSTGQSRRAERLEAQADSIESTE